MEVDITGRDLCGISKGPNPDPSRNPPLISLRDSNVGGRVESVEQKGHKAEETPHQSTMGVGKSCEYGLPQGKGSQGESKCISLEVIEAVLIFPWVVEPVGMSGLMLSDPVESVSGLMLPVVL